MAVKVTMRLIIIESVDIVREGDSQRDSPSFPDYNFENTAFTGTLEHALLNPETTRERIQELLAFLASRKIKLLNSHLAAASQHPQVCFHPTSFVPPPTSPILTALIRLPSTL